MGGVPPVPPVPVALPPTRPGEQVIAPVPTPVERKP
jgi:hypothetical protein